MEPFDLGMRARGRDLALLYVCVVVICNIIIEPRLSVCLLSQTVEVKVSSMLSQFQSISTAGSLSLMDWTLQSNYVDSKTVSYCGSGDQKQGSR